MSKDDHKIDADDRTIFDVLNERTPLTIFSASIAGSRSTSSSWLLI